MLIVFLISACSPLNISTRPVDMTQTARPTSTSTQVSTETLQPTKTKVPATFTPTPVFPMTTYFDKETGMRISYPAHWVEKSHRFFSGDDGYLLIKNADQYHSRNLWNVAVDFANTYYPNFGMSCVGFGSVGCAIYDTNRGESDRIVDIFPYATTAETARYIYIETTFRYYLQIERSIVQNEKAFRPTSTDSPTQVPDPIAYNFNGVSLKEINYKDDNTFLKEIVGVYCGVSNEASANYKFDLINEANYKFELIKEEGGRMQIKKKGETIFSYSSTDFVGEVPWTFCQWGDSWMMENHEIVIIDGKILNHETGMDEIFGWHLLKGKPVYFAKTGTKYSIFVDGKMLPVKYDDISHYQCCAGHAWNPETNGIITNFFALRNGVWYSVFISLN